jgi:ferritin-like metal-binding protein YciE
VTRLEKCFELLGEKPRGKHCDGIAGIVEEGKSIMEEDFGPELMDAALVSGAQRAEHYEMASYGSLIAWARTLGHTHVAQILKETLDEEEAADKKLSTLAEGGINRAAAEAKPSESAPARKKASKRKAPARKAPARKAGAKASN